MATRLELQNMKREYENERRVDPEALFIRRYTEHIKQAAIHGRRYFDIIDINESKVDIVVERLQKLFPDVTITVSEYVNPVMTKPQKTIRIDWS
jgi:hypothetical protein